MSDYKYDDRILKRLQKVELIILKQFDEICQKHGLDYFLIGGTALGAVRHGGFIPWDDDIDVGMHREDYDKFLIIAQQQYNDKYEVVNNETNPYYPSMHTHWVLNGTKFIPLDFKDVRGNLGIFLDVFCFDNVPDDNKKMKMQATKAWIWSKFLVLSGVSRPTLYVYGWKAKIVLMISFIVHWCIRILHIRPRFFYNRAKKQMLMYKKEETKRMAYMFEPKRYISMMEKSDIYPIKRMKFDNLEVSVPNNIEKLLETRYGNFMEIPPKGKRHNHPPYFLDFGEYGED